MDPTSSTFNRSTVQRDFSLLIRDVQSSDASELYQCEVNVTDGTQTIVRRAPLISVEVLGMMLYVAKRIVHSLTSFISLLPTYT